MMPKSAPTRLHLVRHRELYWLLFPAASILLIAAGSWVGIGIYGDDVDDGGAGGWDETAWIGIGFLVAVPAGMWLILSVWQRVNERRRAEAVLAGAVAVWPQYATEAQWRRVIDEDSRSPTRRIDVVVPIVIVTVVFGAFGGWAVAAGEPAFAFPLGAFWLVVMGLLFGRHWMSARERATNRTRRESIAPFPSCWVAEDGVYDEDWGLVLIDQVRAVEFVVADRVADHRRRLKARSATIGAIDLGPLDIRLAKSGWGQLAITIDTGVARTVWRKVERFIGGDQRRWHEGPSMVHVRVPPGHDGEAHTVVGHITARWLSRRPDAQQSDVR